VSSDIERGDAVISDGEPEADASVVRDGACGGAIPADVSTGDSLGGEVEELELPNILFNNPPWEEKLLLLFPASLVTVCCSRPTAKLSSIEMQRM
jgi:hypothetical protein